MAIYQYSAKDLQGLDHKGTIETSDPHQVARILSKKGLIVITIQEKRQSSGSVLNQFLNRVSFSDLVVMTRQMATMIQSGLVLSEALDILQEQQNRGKLKEVLEQISRDVKSGLDLASAMRKHPAVFPALYINLIRAGEKSGKLDTTLAQLAVNLEKDREFRSRIRGAMIYPIIVVTMMVLVMSIMMFFVIPKLIGLYTQSNIDLPLPTKILIATSNIFTKLWWLILASLIIGFIVFRRWIATTSGKLTFDKFLLHVPIVSKIIKGTALTNFMRTFGLLTAAGIPILDAISIVSGIIGNSVYQNALKECFRGVERGLTFSAQLELTNVFPKIVSQMIRVGEETGKVDDVSYKLAEYFESETDNLVKNITVIIEPVILVMLGAGVAFLVLSIILPIYKLTTSFS